MKKKIERKIRDFFPTHWTRADIEHFLGSIGYEIDVSTLDFNLNVPIRDFVLRGGKRIRPSLFLTVLEIFGKDPSEYFDFAVLIELIHNGTLVLDDIEDDASLRRGKSTVHIKYGLDTATNVGAALHFLPLRIILDRDKLNSNLRLRLWEVYAEELINVSFGQALDIYWHKSGNNGVYVNKYLEMVRLKTGSLMRMAARMACVLAEQDKRVEDSFRDYAEGLGMAFQIVDDILDLRADREKFGKAWGNDITEGKVSLPVIYAMKRVSADKKNRLKEILAKHTRDRKLIAEAISIIEESRGVDEAYDFAKKLVDRSRIRLERKVGNIHNLSKLRELGNYFVERSH